MQTTFKITRTSREIYAKWLDGYSLEQLNKIPQGFSNNLIWNIGHIVVSQQLLVYAGSGLPMMVSDEIVAKYRRGSKPEGNVTQGEVEEIKNLLFATIEKTEDDYKNDVFISYNERTSELGFKLTSTEDAIVFNNYHEAIHLGIMMQLRKFI